MIGGEASFTVCIILRKRRQIVRQLLEILIVSFRLGLTSLEGPLLTWAISMKNM
ncbi:hypothetical protein JCM19037_4332 [Geomicrobium sp. JCM 19037]|nr:hypothetical protein JCM19037_4332 [Geomicrobium sp. JCM 19037]